MTDAVPTDLHPVLQERLNEVKLMEPYPHDSLPGTHAEVYAVNRALRDREAAGIPVDASSLREIVLDNRQFYGGRGMNQIQHRPIRCCPNCTLVLNRQGGAPVSIPGWRQARLSDGTDDHE